jgi:hypothetical protein
MKWKCRRRVVVPAGGASRIQTVPGQSKVIIMSLANQIKTANQNTTTPDRARAVNPATAPNRQPQRNRTRSTIPVERHKGRGAV